jgi:hypothetical protein
MWASVAMPYHRQVMSAPVLKAAVLAMLIRRVKAPEWDGWMPGSLPNRGKRGMGGLVLGLVFWMGDPSSSAWSGGSFVRYELYDSPVVCRWSVSIVSVPMGHSWHPIVLGYFTPTTTANHPLARRSEIISMG